MNPEPTLCISTRAQVISEVKSRLLVLDKLILNVVSWKKGRSRMRVEFAI